MPTYEYQCPDGHLFDKFQKMTDRPRAKCPACGKQATRKISGGAGLVFKGSGFYITDYPKKSSSDASKAGASQGKSDSSSSSKSEGSSSDSGTKSTDTSTKKDT